MSPTAPRPAEPRLVATLIARPDRPVIDSALVTWASGLLTDTASPDWLAPGTAVDIEHASTTEPPRAIADRLRAALGEAPVDVVVQPIAGRRKRLFLADMDSTMIEQECIDELADKLGLKPHVAEITERAMRGEIAFAPALRERVALLKGLPVKAVDDLIRDRITLTPGGRVLVGTLRAHGAYACLVSGGFTLFTDRIATMIGFDEARANRLVVQNDELAGRVEEPIFGQDDKLATLRDLAGRFGLEAADAMATGDGANDIPMIAAAGMGVAFRAKPAVKAEAAAQIDHGDLTALLYVQGYRDTEFAAA